MSVSHRPSDLEINALVDGELVGGARQQVEAAAARSSEAMQEIESLRQLNAELVARYQRTLDEPVPHRMTAVLAGMREPSSARVRQRAVAAGLALALATATVAYLVRDTLAPGLLRSEAGIARTALGAHAVYAGEVRHPVEVAASEEAHLVQWLTKRIGANVRAPLLAAHGFRLVGGRLLPDQGRPAAQLMYEDAKGRRVTLYMRKEIEVANTSFRLSRLDKLETFYWIDRPLAYALVGEVPQEELMRLARAVYEQVN